MGTTTPTKELDINGELRIRNIPSATSAPEVLTADVDGNIKKFETFLVSDVKSIVANTNVDYANFGINIADNIDLGLSTSAIIPANTEALIVIKYSVPIGISNFVTTEGYYGIRFLRNAIEESQASRKFSILKTETTANMVSVANIYTEKLTPSPTERTITYTLNGYIEQYQSGLVNYRFNMWSSTGTNFNWGRATLTKIVYLK